MTGFNSLKRQAFLRLLSVVFLGLLLSTAGIYWLYLTTYDRSGSIQADAASLHFKEQLRDLSTDWEKEALRLKAGIEVLRFMDDEKMGGQKLFAYLTAHKMGEDIYQAVEIADLKGNEIFRFGAVPEDMTAAIIADEKWIYSAAEERLYRVFSQSLWLGRKGMGRLSFIKAIDNALLHNLAYPGTELFVSWRERIVAGSRGEGSVKHINKGIDGAFEIEGVRHEQRILKWEEGPSESPSLIMHLHVSPPFSPRESFLLGAFILGSLIFFLWLGLGSWLAATVRRILNIEEAAARFGRERTFPPEARQQLEAGSSGRNDELAHLATSLAGMMETVVLRDREMEVAAAATERSEARLRLLLDSAAEGVYFIDMDGRCTLVNKAALNMLGYAAAEDLIGKYMHKTIHHTRADGSHYPWEECFAHKAVIAKEGCHLDTEVFWRADGSSFHVEYWAYPVLEGGSIIGSITTFIDMTERRAAQESMRIAMENLENSNRELEQFAYVASHDLQEPLRKVASFTELLAKRYKGQLGEDADRYINYIVDGADRMRTLIRDLLAYSRAGKQTKDLEQVDCGKVVLQVISPRRYMGLLF